MCIFFPHIVSADIQRVAFKGIQENRMMLLKMIIIIHVLVSLHYLLPLPGNT